MKLNDEQITEIKQLIYSYLKINREIINTRDRRVLYSIDCDKLWKYVDNNYEVEYLRLVIFDIMEKNNYEIGYDFDFFKYVWLKEIDKDRREKIEKLKQNITQKSLTS